MSDPEPVELPRGIALAWGVAANPQRGPKREMSVELIVEKAIELADAEGIGAVSMAAVAKRLGFTPMSLYRYVTAKDDLLLLMQDGGTGVPSEAYRSAEGWREKLTVLYREQVEIYMHHPWLLSLPISGSPITPNSSEWIEAGFDALSETPLNDDERMAAVLAGTGQARWNGMVLAGYTEEARSTGMSEEEVGAREGALYDAVITAEAYPQLRAAIDAGVFVSDADPFGWGFERTLDGIESYIEALDRGEPHRASRDWAEPDDLDVAGDRKYRAAAKAAVEARKAVLQAEKALRQARKEQRQALKEAKERLGRADR